MAAGASAAVLRTMPIKVASELDDAARLTVTVYDTKVVSDAVTRIGIGFAPTLMSVNRIT